MDSLIKYFSRDIPSLFDDSDFFFNRRSLGFFDGDNVKVDVVEKDDQLEVVAVTPGFDKKDIKIEYEKGYLTVSGEVKEEKEEKKKYLYREIGSKTFARRFYLGDSFDKQNIDANFKNGVLTITLPKKEEEKLKEIEIK